MSFLSRTRRRASTLTVLCALLVAALAAACATSPAETREERPDAQPRRGGSLTVLENVHDAGAWPGGFDPLTVTDGANQSYMNAIFGQLFKMGDGGKVIPGLATGHERLPDGKTVDIFLREGVTFSDGTPFDADAVAFNIERSKKSVCACRAIWPLESAVARGDHTVRLNFSKPYGPVIESFFASPANWIASPTALKKAGQEEFALKPVGAGPFRVVSNEISEELVLERNPGYWEEGKPYLDELIFRSVDGDQKALDEIRAGKADVYEEMTSPNLEKGFEDAGFTVTYQPPTAAYGVQFNTLHAPFDNLLAREAIYYATDVGPIKDEIFNNVYPDTESFTGPGGICHQPEVEGYRGHDPEKAKALVRQLGGLRVSLTTINQGVARQTTEMLKKQWEAVGITTDIHALGLEDLIREASTGGWQSMIQVAGSYDPAGGIGVHFRYASHSPFSGVHDPRLDKMLDEAATTLDRDTRCRVYGEVAAYINEKAYSPFFFSIAPANVTAKGVRGPGLTTLLPSVVFAPMVLWEDVYREA